MSMLNHFFDYKPEVLALDEKAMELCQPYFHHMEEIRDYNQLKMLKAFADTQMSSTDMLGTTGYGLWDTGRAKLEQIFAQVMGAEDALVRSQFQSGTHTLAVALFGLLRTGDTLLAATGRPYDTLEGVIGIGEAGKGCGTLQEYGIHYDEVPLLPDFTPDYAAIAEHAKTATVVHIQRSRGYELRASLSLEETQKVAEIAKEKNPNCIVMVDNCYCEFVNKQEPTQVGADLIAGSLIKNAGGGMARTGGYIAGRHDLVEKCAFRLTTPGLGREVGATLGMNRELYMGLFYAPHTVGEALKSAVYIAALYQSFGYDVTPKWDEPRQDIVQCLGLENPDSLVAFCQGVQSGSPIDSFVLPEPWDMPGYDSQVVMAAGAFTLGSSIELSADAPIRPPYYAWIQGGLQFHSAKICAELAAQQMQSKGLLKHDKF